jgi:superfamily II DNA/RNA helicase
MARGMEAGGEGEQVRYAISYDAPRHLDTYVHRAGRTARAGKAGTAITLLEKKEVRTALFASLSVGRHTACFVWSSWPSGKGVGPESERSGVRFPNCS